MKRFKHASIEIIGPAPAPSLSSDERWETYSVVVVIDGRTPSYDQRRRIEHCVSSSIDSDVNGRFFHEWSMAKGFETLAACLTDYYNKFVLSVAVVEMTLNGEAWSP